MTISERPAQVAQGTFAEPDAAHSPCAYWFWHHVPRAEEIRDQVADMRAGGFRSFQVQARLAFPMSDYLSEDYLDACLVAVEEAARHGMTVGIYDDYNWQSGHAAGRTVAGRDDLRERHVFWATVPVAEVGGAEAVVDRIVSSTEGLGPAAMLWQYDDGTVLWDEWTVVAAAVHPPQPRSADAVVDVTDRVALVHADGASARARLTGQPTSVDQPSLLTVFLSARAATSRLPNYLLRESAERFIDVGYEPYARKLADHLGRTVQYVFFDQPHGTFYDWAQRAGNLRSSLPWSAELSERAGSDQGAPRATVLTALVHDLGPDTARLRTGFYATFTELAQQNFLGVLSRWCATHGLKLSGHEVLGHVGSWHPTSSFDTWDLRVNFGIDHFGVDAYRHLSAVDAQDCVPQLSAKLGDSVARSNGRSGCIVEQYLLGTWPQSYPGDWDMTLQQVRGQAMRLHLAGARQFLFHAYYQTDGNAGDDTFFVNPRFDFAPGINFEPWWPLHRDFAIESARLSIFIDDADPVCEVALFWPLRTAWAEGPKHSWADHVAAWAELLARGGYGHHVVDERDVRSARVVDGGLLVGDRRYAALVLPSVTTVEDASTVRHLESLVEAGGRVVASGDVPVAGQRCPAEEVARAWAALSQHGSAHHVSGPPTAEVLAGLFGDLSSRRPRLDVGAAQVWQWAGIDRDGWRLAALNDSDDWVDVRLSTPFERVAVQVWDPADGSVGAWRVASSGSVELPLAPNELVSVRVRAGDGDADLGGSPLRRQPTHVLVLDGDWAVELSGPSGRLTTTLTADAGWTEQGHPDVSGVGCYRRTVRLDRVHGLAWRLELPEVHSAVEVRVNGIVAGRRGWAPFDVDIDPGLVHVGDNELEIAVHSTAGNHYLAGTRFAGSPAPAGLGASPRLVATTHP